MNWIERYEALSRILHALSLILRIVVWQTRILQGEGGVKLKGREGELAKNVKRAGEKAIISCF